MKKSLLFMAFVAFTSSLLWAQDVVKSGTVVDIDDGAALPGVSVVVKGTTIGTVTNFDGSYSINVPPASTTLVFSFVGMLTQEVGIQGGSIIDVTLETDAFGIEEVVVTAYGTKRKGGLTGSVSVVESDAFDSKPISSFDQMIQGTSAGVQVVTSNGAP